MKRLVLSVAALAISTVLFAQNIKRPDTYNFNRGVEAIENENYQEALEYLNKDLSDNPKNGYAFALIAVIRNYSKEYGRALTAADLAIKYLPKKDEEYTVLAYMTRAAVYMNLEDTVNALSDYESAIRLYPSKTDGYESRGQIYFEQEKYDLSDADYRMIVKLDPGNTIGYMGLGRNALMQKRWEEALKHFDYVLKLDDSYVSAYSFRAEVYSALEKWNEATDDLLSAMKLKYDPKALYMLEDLKEPAFSMMVSKLKIQAAKQPNNAIWPSVLAKMYETNGQYKKAISYYDESNRIDPLPSAYFRKALCYSLLGDYRQAMQETDLALNMDSTGLNYMALKADLYYDLGDMKAAIEGWDKVIATDPEYGYGYYRRGWFKYHTGDLDAALEDLSMAIVLEPDYSYAYVSRGDIYLKQGKKELAEDDFKKVIEIEEKADEYDCIFFAYLGLGQNDKAIETLNATIEKDTTDASYYYEATCVYSRMKDKEKALMYFEKCLEMGYSNFAHIERDFDLDFIRDTKKFKSLVDKYKAKQQQGNNEEKQNSSSRMVTTEVPFTKEGGVCKVKCKINGLPLHFVFDTGASDVTLSMVEATFMMKNDYLKSTDVIGNQHYMDANGDVSVGTVINLRNVNFGDLELNNIRASVVRNQKAPLLLGQSVLGRLGKIEIDNHHQVLKITHQDSIKK